MGVFDVAEDAAGADRGELLIITDQPDTRTAIRWRTGRRVSRVRVSAMPASSMITKVDGPTAAAQSGSSPCCRDQVSLARVSARMPVCSPRTAAAAADGARPMHLAAVLGPGQGEGAHGGGLPGAGRGDRQLQPGTRGAHLPDQRSLPGIQGGAVRRHLQQRQIHRRLVDRLSRRGVRRW